MMGRLHVDLFFQDRYLLNGVDVKIRLVQSKDAFALMATGAKPENTYRRGGVVREKSEVEPLRADGSHQGVRESDSQVPGATSRLQSVLDTARRNV